MPTSPVPESRLIAQALGLNADQLKGQVALVTGAARGIGEHTARALARLGARVVLADRSEQGEQVAHSIRDSGGQAHFIHCDVGNPEAIERLVAGAQNHFGPVAILINNAVQLQLGRVLDQPASNWLADFQVNLLGPLMLIQHLVPGMLQRRHGVVISLISLEGMPFMGNYCANKMALRSMMLSLGKEVPPDSGVSIFSVMPGAVDTPLAQDMIRTFSDLLGIPEHEVRASMSNNPGYGGLIPVDHTAASLAWFCVNAAQFHGQFVDGYLPMSQAGLIDVDASVAVSIESLVAPPVVPNPALDLKQLIHINRSLENRIHERTRELEAANLKLQEASLTDPLTGLWNRRFADISMREEIAFALRKSETGPSGIYVVMIDVDHFKDVNDLYGHAAGDEVLKAMATILKAQCRTSDKIMRWGGEEFLVVLKDIQSDQMEILVERIRKAVADHGFAIGGGIEVHCTCSLGFAALPLIAGASDMSWEAVVSMADLCMYAAKKNGRNRWIGMEVVAATAGLMGTPPSTWHVASLIERGDVRIVGSDKAAHTIVW